METLKQILSLHELSHHPEELPDSLGDAYLCLNNPVHLALRRAVRKCGFSFGSEEFGNYLSTRPFHLPEMIETRKIPYGLTYPALVALEAQHPGLFLFDEVPGVVPNWLIYESARCLMHHNLKPTANPIERAAVILAAEAFGLACETIGSIAAKSTAHQCMYSANALQGMSEALTHERARDVFSAAGSSAGSRLIFLCALSVLCERKRFDELEIKKSVRTLDVRDELSEPAVNAAKRLFSIYLLIRSLPRMMTASRLQRLRGLESVGLETVIETLPVQRQFSLSLDFVSSQIGHEGKL